MHWIKRFRVIIFLGLLTGFIGIQQEFIVIGALGEFPPAGFEIAVHRVALQPEEPYIEIENATLNAFPVLKEILDEAVFWAQKNMNQTQYWVLWEQLSQILELLNQLYVAKYGMTSYQYAETYNTTLSDPVVNYNIYYFALTHPEGPKMIIRQVHLKETDPYLDWNNTILESIQALKKALNTAMAWAQHNVTEILYHFENLEVFETIQNALVRATSDKYGMSWYHVAQAHNSTLYDHVVAYSGYYFSFGWSFPEEAPLPFLWLIILAVTVVVLIGIVILGITLLNFKHLRSELPIKLRVAFKTYNRLI